MKRASIIIAAAFCCTLGIWFPNSASAKENWISVRSQNFLLIGNASEKEIRQVGMRLEQFRQVFTRLFTGVKFNTPVPTTVVVFKSDSSYRPFKPNATTAGYFQPGPDVNYITLTTEVRGEQDPFTVIFHEYTHLLTNNTMGNIPLWFNEGLAEYYSSFGITDDRKVILGKPIASHVYLLRENKMLPLRTLFQVDHKSPHYNERDKQSIFYAESWALVHYLIGGNNGQRVGMLDKFMKAMDANVPMEQAFQQAFQTTFENMEQELRAYIKRDTYPVVNQTFSSKLEFDREMEAAPLSEAEAQAYLGDLLLHSNRECEAYLQKALALDPNQSLANSALAMVKVKQGKFAEARQTLERAIAANSQSYLIHYYYAYALSREGMDATNVVTEFAPETESRMRDELKKAIALRPEFSESYRLLVFVNLVTGNQLDESIDMLKRVLATSPGRNDLLYMLAQVYMRKEDFKSARQLLERVSENKNDTQPAQLAKGMLAQIKRMEEERARYETMTKAEGSGIGTGADRSSHLGTNPPRPTNRGAATDANPAVETNPLSYLREALKKPEAGEKQVQGTLVRIDCDAKGIVFTIKVEDGMLKLRSDRLETVQFVAFTSDAGGQITCGPFKPANSVVVVYAPASDARAKVDGTPKSIEFVPKEFKLKG